MSPYEIWVFRLRQWVIDPVNTRLDDLPAIRAEDYTVDTMTRFAGHLRSSLEESMACWQATLARNVGQASSAYELTTVLIRLRTTLARQMRLTQHPGLPAEFRQVFGDQTARSIERLQSDLEKTIGHDDEGSTSRRTQRDSLLRAVREAPLTAAITLGYEKPSADLITPLPSPAPYDGDVAPAPAGTMPFLQQRRYRIVRPITPPEYHQ